MPNRWELAHGRDGLKNLAEFRDSTDDQSASSSDDDDCPAAA